MTKRQKAFYDGNMCQPTSAQMKLHPKPTICFPFGETENHDHDIIVAKILMVNYRESVRINNIHINQLAKYIANVMHEEDWSVLKQHANTDAYINIVEKIAHGHGVYGKKTNSVENDLTSFASKFCGHHNQEAPFFDGLVYDALRSWNYDIQWRNYRQYVTAFQNLQAENSLQEFSLRHIESYIWELAKSYDSDTIA